MHAPSEDQDVSVAAPCILTTMFFEEEQEGM